MHQHGRQLLRSLLPLQSKNKIQWQEHDFFRIPPDKKPDVYCNQRGKISEYYNVKN